jgi:carbonic anhydrase
MEAILRGVEHFQKFVYPKERELYRSLANAQDPYALVITCSDSRIVPSQVTQTRPGDLFICRNAGNIVPAHGVHSGGVTATIEYAIMALKVSAVIVWGHTNCGAMKGLLYPEKTKTLPAVSAWLHHAERARMLVEHALPDASEEEKLHLLARENVAAQLDNLRTHPFVAVALAKGKLALHGWVFDIETAELDSYDERNKTWGPLLRDAEPQLQAAD